MKKGWFGFDHSQFYAVEFEINEPFIRNTNELKGEEGKVEERKQFPTMLLKKLASHRRIDKKLSYED